MSEQLKVASVAISKLTPDPNNVRRHSEKNLAAIRRSLELFGQRKPVVAARANDGSLVIIAGNGTLEAAQSLGWTHLAVAEVPADWDAEKARAFAIADNRTAELADWDSIGLANALVDLDAVGWNSDDLGFTNMEDMPETADIRLPAPGSADFAEIPDEDKYEQQYGVNVICSGPEEQMKVYEAVTAMGFKCRVVTV